MFTHSLIPFTAKRSLVFLLVATLVCTIASGQTWTAYTNADAAFTVKFPGEYSIEETESEDSKTLKVTHASNDIIYFASCTFHQNDLSIISNEELCKVSLNAFTETIKGTVKSEKVWKLGKDKGRQALVDIPEQNAKLSYRVVILGDKQYQLVAIGTSENYNKKVVGKFMKSFKLLK